MRRGSSDLPREAWSSLEAAALYERARPGYAHAAINFIGRELSIGPGMRVLDLGAGTGKLSRQMLTLGADIVAVEPLEAMRSAFSVAVPRATILNGSAEAIPLSDASVDAIVAGQAWHWFDSSRAVTEASRVVRPGAGLALLWNEYDEGAPWMEEYAAIRKRAAARSRAAAPSHTDDDWRRGFSGRPDWSPLRKKDFRHQVEVTREAFVERVFSSSVFALLSKREQQDLKSELLAMLDRATGIRDPQVISVPYRTEVFWSVFRPT